ncbi:hypothetical protein NDA10_000255 [Ustilago hordei]|uniref:Uncharacterized protein n=1 Tax=Ustilago hordei TaxID=120017 RepID=I2FST2_USTHO|nr:hypothetical protein NDA10_000255 [Ustilago hordei]KAJ1587195.1 hypothetical protein NDA15_003053 [Ustilago hordei]KAJ1590330.1 hypothetical protein NDA12_006241 [Ustilago hordei]UTT96626.1 hypothetical protein NDA17_007697 [Ustilago hordei]CCF49975.1 uncharacterized protein UHOR_14098 [Ustilago hordei]
MVSSRRQTRLQMAASMPPPAEAATPARRRQIIPCLRPREALVPAATPPSSPISARVANPLASPVAPSSPLVPLFLGMDDDTVIPGPPGSPVPPGPLGED